MCKDVHLSADYNSKDKEKEHNLNVQQRKLRIKVQASVW